MTEPAKKKLRSIVSKQPNKNKHFPLSEIFFFFLQKKLFFLQQFNIIVSAAYYFYPGIFFLNWNELVWKKVPSIEHKFDFLRKFFVELKIKRNKGTKKQF